MRRSQFIYKLGKPDSRIHRKLPDAMRRNHSSIAVTEPQEAQLTARRKEVLEKFAALDSRSQTFLAASLPIAQLTR